MILSKNCLEIDMVRTASQDHIKKEVVIMKKLNATKILIIISIIVIILGIITGIGVSKSLIIQFQMKV